MQPSELVQGICGEELSTAKGMPSVVYINLGGSKRQPWYLQIIGILINHFWTDLNYNGRECRGAGRRRRREREISNTSAFLPPANPNWSTHLRQNLDTENLTKIKKNFLLESSKKFSIIIIAPRYWQINWKLIQICSNHLLKNKVEICKSVGYKANTSTMSSSIYVFYLSCYVIVHMIYIVFTN